MTNSFFKKIKDFDIGDNARGAILGTMALSYVFLLASSGEDRKDQERKPALIENIVQHSVASSDTTHAEKTHMNYGYRLAYLLRECESKHLDVLQQHGISVVLDNRLYADGKKATEKSESFNAALYRDAKILSIADDGSIGHNFLSDNTADHVADVVAAVARKLSAEGLEAQKDVTFIRDVKKYPAQFDVKVEKTEHVVSFKAPTR